MIFVSKAVPINEPGAPRLDGAAVWEGDDARLIRSCDIAGPAARTLGHADALVLRGNGAVTIPQQRARPCV